MGDKVTVGDYVSLQRGITYKGNLVGKPGPALLGLGSIQPGGGFREGDYKTYGGECPPKLMLSPGDLFVSLKGATKDGKMIGSVARVPPSVPSGRLTQDTVKLQFDDSDREASNFLYWVLRTPQYRDYCAGRATGSAVVALSRDDFLAYPVPALTTVRMRIVELLSALDDRIGLNRRMNETLEAMARALFHNWFVDATQAGLPKGWRVATIAELAEINSWTLAKDDELDRVEYVEISEVSHGNINNVQIYQRGKEPSRARRRLRHGDTVVSTVRPDRGSYFLCLQPSPGLIASTGFAVITATKAPWSFIHAALTQPEFFDHLGQQADGGAYPAVRPEIIGNWEVPLPDNPAVVEAFHRICAPLFERAEHNRFESRTLAALRDALLPKLLSGELRLPASTKLMEAKV